VFPTTRAAAIPHPMFAPQRPYYLPLNYRFLETLPHMILAVIIHDLEEL